MSSEVGAAEIVFGAENDVVSPLAVLCEAIEAIFYHQSPLLQGRQVVR